MKKSDIVLIIVLLCLAGLAYLGVWIYQNSSTEPNSKVVIYVDGERYSEYPLDSDTEFTVKLEDEKYNVVSIKNGYADVTEASCPDKICAKHRRINKNGQTITCLPNKLVVQIENGTEAEIDGVSR